MTLLIMDDNYLTKFTDRLLMTTKVGLKLQSLMIDYRWLQKSDLDYKVHWYDHKWLQKLDLEYKVYWYDYKRLPKSDLDYKVYW